MARPPRNTVDYFPHILGEGKKMFFIETKYGNDGYATWYKILEKLGSTEFHYLNLNAEEEVLFLASKCKVDEDRLLNIINDLVKINVFNRELWASKIIWSQQFVDSIEDAYRKRNNKCITLEGLRRNLDGLGITKPVKDQSKGGEKPQTKVEETKVEETKENNKPDLIDFFFNDLENSQEFEKLTKSYPRDELISFIPVFRDKVNFEYPSFKKFVEHFRNSYNISKNKKHDTRNTITKKVTPGGFGNL